MKTIYKKLLECGFVLIIFCFISLVIKKYFTPFFFIIILIILSTPIDKLLSGIHNNKIRSLFTIIIVNILIFIVLFFLGNYIYDFLYSFINKNYMELQDNLNNLLKYYKDTAQWLNLDISSKGLISGDYLKRGALYTGEGIVAYFIGNIATYFILSDKYDILNFINSVLEEEIFNKLRYKIYQLRKVITIEIRLVLMSTITTTLGFYILKIPKAFLLGIFCGILDILPYVGTIIVFIPLLLYNILVKKYFIVIGLVALYIFVEIIRQILETKFISNRLSIHPLAVLISIYIGIKVLGIVGLITGPLYVIVAKEILIT